MAIIEIRGHSHAANDGNGVVQAPGEPAVAVHFLDTGLAAQTSPAFSESTKFISIHADVNVAYEVAESNPDSANGPKRGLLRAANSLPYSMGVAPGAFIEVNG